MKRYRIRDGHTFRVSDKKVLTGGDTIELEDDVAATFAEKVELVTEEESASAEAGVGQATSAADVQTSGKSRK